MLLCHTCALRSSVCFFDITLPHMRIALEYLFLWCYCTTHADCVQVSVALMLLCCTCALHLSIHFFDVTVPHMRITFQRLLLWCYCATHADCTQVPISLLLLSHTCALRLSVYFFDVIVPKMRIALKHLFLWYYSLANAHSFNKAWTQVLRRFKSCSWRVGDSRWWGSLTMVPDGNKAKRLSSVNHITKTTYHHHHHHHHCVQVSISLMLICNTCALHLAPRLPINHFNHHQKLFLRIMFNYTLGEWTIK